MKTHKPYYRRKLPHIQPKDGVFALTICLAGSLPKHRILELKDERALLIAEVRKEGKIKEEIKAKIKEIEERYFHKFDDLLDKPMSGKTWLAETQIVNIIANSLNYLDEKEFKIIAYCIMSNHIHLVVYQCEKQLFDILNRFKSYTGLMANNLIYGKSKKGENRKSFWMKESYDHLMRDRNDFNNQVRYVVNNPVKAKLVQHWKEWKFTYIRDEFKYLMEKY